MLMLIVEFCPKILIPLYFLFHLYSLTRNLLKLGEVYLFTAAEFRLTRFLP